MSSRIENIIVRARDTLSDLQGDRWDDDRLIRLISEAQELIAIDAELVKKTYTGTVVSGTAEYTTPSDCAIVTRLSINSTRVPVKTFEYLDEKEIEWEADTSESVDMVLFDKTDPDKFILYPIPTDPTYTSYKLYYIAIPVEVTKLTDSLVVPKFFDKAIKHYIVGMCFRDDQDTQNRAIGADELSLYNLEFRKAARLGGLNFNNTSTLATVYRGFE